MTISYNWLCDYLPVSLPPNELAEILTSIGLEVESLEEYEEVRGSLRGLLIGEVLEVRPHPNADKLRIAMVNTGQQTPLKIVCGAPNVAAGQKVVVAPVGSTIYPIQNEPVTMKLAKIRGEESEGMICAEDEIGLGNSHDGILVLDQKARAGMSAAEYFRPAADWVYEIGLTPNRMDAMSHLGVARDVCAYLGNRDGKKYEVRRPSVDGFQVSSNSRPIDLKIENTEACPRYTGVSISGVKVGPSPVWLQQKLKSIGLRPINNIVDITNFVLHESGQPLHAFDAEKIQGRQIRVKNLPAGTPFTTLDEKTRKLDAEDIMICDEKEGLCIAGVFGGLHSGVQEQTTEIFLESAFFNPTSIRRSSFRHGLRTDAAIRFEKGVDISNLLFALKRAALLICELGGGKISSEIMDVYPQPIPQKEVSFTYGYLQKISGRAYKEAQVQNILEGLGFRILSQEAHEQVKVAVPYSKPDISLPADIAEEIMRIDGYDNIEIPTHITISPSLSSSPDREALREKTAAYLSNNGFYEIFTNSITNSQYYSTEEQEHLVRLKNNLSAELDVMRPAMLETGLESIAHNLNRQQSDLLLYEFGKTYHHPEPSKHIYEEKERLCLYATGYKLPENWLHKQEKTDRPFIKGHLVNILAQLGLRDISFESSEAAHLQQVQALLCRQQSIGFFGEVQPERLKRFDIRQPVWYASLNWEQLIALHGKVTLRFREIPRYPSVRRDLALILNKAVRFEQVEEAARSVKSGLLTNVHLFDVFESEKLGHDKKSYAVSFTFQHPEKTLTDKEIDKVMEKLVQAFEKQLEAEIRK